MKKSFIYVWCGPLRGLGVYTDTPRGMKSVAKDSEETPETTRLLVRVSVPGSTRTLRKD